MTLTIDPEFAGKIPPLTDEELQQLEENILEDGRVINPLITWNGVIVDGHNRFRILQAHPEIPYTTFEKEFPDRFAVMAWICRTQLGRRNLTPDQKKYLIGKQYEVEKASNGGLRNKKRDESGQFTTGGQNDHLWSPDKTGERIAKESGVSERYVRRAEKYAQGLDAAEEVLPGIRQEVLSGKLKSSDKEITAIAKASPEDRPELARRLTEPKPAAPPGRASPRRASPPEEPEEMQEDDDTQITDTGDDEEPEEGITTLPPPAPKKTKAQELREIKAISDAMLHPRGEDTMEDVLYELNDALQSMIFRWNFSIETHEKLYRKRENRRQIKELAKEGITFLRNIGGKELHEAQ